jgi:hypothetical protein
MIDLLTVEPIPTQAPVPATLQSLAPDIAYRFGTIMANLAALVPARFHRNPTFVHLILPLWYRFTRTARRFERLMAQIATNTLPKPRPPRPHRPTQGAARPTPETPRLAALPTGHLWLIRAIPYEVAAYACQLQHLLSDPATVEILATYPAAARMLRPLARMLGIDAPVLNRSPANRRPKAAAPGDAAEDRPALPLLHQPPRPEADQPEANQPAAIPRRANPPDPHGPTAPWPYTYRPSAKWPAACRRIPNPA